MLLNQATLRAIRTGAVTLAFRRWRRPTVKAGGTLLTAIGQLAIQAVDAVDLDEVTVSEAQAAGFPDLAAFRARLAAPADRPLYRIRVALAGPDPRIALRDTVPDDAGVAEIHTRLRRIDARSSTGPWTRQILDLVAMRPGERAAELAARSQMETSVFKVRARKLKTLGLIESLPVGYRLSPRGHAVRDGLRPGRQRAQSASTRG